MIKYYTSLRQTLLTLLTALALDTSTAQKHANPLTAIRLDDIKKDVYALADDHFRGREAGTLDELKAASWIAQQAALAGLQPAGEDGTYFQYFPLIRTRVSLQSSVSITGQDYEVQKQVIVYEPCNAKLDVPIEWVNDIFTADPAKLKGKAVALSFSPKGVSNPRLHIPTRYPAIVVSTLAKEAAKKGVAAVLFVSDDAAETQWQRVSQYSNRGSYQIEGSLFHFQMLDNIPILWFHQSELARLKQSGQTLKTDIFTEKFTYPSVNVVAKSEGTDKHLRNEYVLFSSHTDHDGVRYLGIGKDSIYNGADDNASVCASLLAIARAFKIKPAKRCALFIWHGAEERGLFGSTWFAAHPTVERKSIVAVLNGDLFGGNSVDTAALMGSIPPHRSSAQLVNTALKENERVTKFVIDSSWDRTTHAEGWYYRSDHFPYAKWRIPALFFSSNPQPLYHTPADEASTLNYRKIVRLTQWMYATGFAVANNPLRPALDDTFLLDR